ncbi:MAG: HipA domain-containing protein [Propionibacteriaceae bacterium]|jgi:serine/threonine-protein kinase HipA|nr:HipA domain-containing protein [Propionibacteriaceae bacterium]
MVDLTVVMNGRVVGDVFGNGSRLRLRYEPAATTTPDFTALSLSLPADRPRWRGRTVSHWLAGVLPDRETVLRRWRTQFGVASLAPEALLEHVGEDVAGAAQFVRRNRLETVLAQNSDLHDLTESEIAEVARSAKRDSLPYDFDAGVGRFSLAGAQVKFALQKTAQGWALPSGAEPSTHIFKPAIPGLEDQDVAEVMSLRAAADLGLPTATACLASFEDQRVAVVERYDRISLAGRWWRVHQEDLCQALGLSPQLKYESQGGPGVATCADLLWRHCGRADVERFADALIYNYLIRGSDAHARNYAILLTPGNARLAPLFDLNSTLAFGQNWASQLAMRIGGEDRLDAIAWPHWRDCSAQLGLEPDQIRDRLTTICHDLPDALATAAAALDLTGAAGLTSRILVERAAVWCAEAADRCRLV